MFDSEKMPLSGATILEKGTSNGTSADADGNFTMTVKSDKSVIEISYVGYNTKSVTVGSTRRFDIVLEDNAKVLDDVVVIGYGTMDKKELTSAVSHISAEEMLSISSVDPAMQIQGKVAGVSITNTATGDPNNGANIQVRGVSSRNAGLGPLIVIDGVAGGNLHNLSANDIASIDVLKDGAASAIYGTRGSNGVIVVTTKGGAKDGRIHTDYQGYVAWDIPHNELKVLNREEYLAAGLGNDYGADTDWFKEITRTGFTQNHTLSVSGGNQRSNYRATLDTRHATGIDLRAARREYGGRVQFSHDTKNGLFTFMGSVAPRYIRANNSDWSAFKNAFGANPTTPVMDATDPAGRKYYDVQGDGISNPVELLKLDKNWTEYKLLDWHATAKLNLLPLLAKDMTGQMLNAQVTVSQQYNDTHEHWFRPSYHTVALRSGFQGEASQKAWTDNNYGVELITNYMFDRNGHNIKAMAGYSWQTFEQYGFNAENKDFPSDALTWNNLGQGTYNQDKEGRLGMGSWKNTSKLISFFGRVSYNYAGKYMATASLRYEGSSRFGENNKWGYFPAFSLGWRISQENFMAGTRGWLDDLKIRGDFGVTGNQNIGNYMSLATYGGYGTVAYNGKYYKGWAPNKNPNPNLRWEKAENWNVGIDFSLFNSLVTGSVNYYNRTQKDLLGDYNVSVPPYLHTTIYTNVGKMRNNGIEVELDINAVRTRDFSYTIGLVGATNQNKFISFSNELYKGQEYVWTCGMTSPGSPGSLQQIREGERIGSYV
ncbi:MAG: SusC/RagA family TonB-linked outer membrane protein, partial [Muribaculaceae bacterium]|nr:SusC/RagA family TonB-linked outer membrane protein [Muribaculaceae bacterium]